MSNAAPLQTDLFTTVFPLRAGRVHEAFGSGAVGFAAILAGKSAGETLWVTQHRAGNQLNPCGLIPFCDPARILTAACRDQTDALAVTEESLRSGAVSLVVTEISKPLSLTAGRRLQLASQAGQVTGLCLIPEGMGSNAAETRWNCTPLFDPKGCADSTLMRWQITKNKTGTIGAWDVRHMQQTRRFDVVPAAAD